MAKCKECGNTLEENTKFCSNCGSKVTIINQDKSVEADIKAEVTNATTEKAFKKVSETISNNKKIVKTAVKILIPIAIILTIAVVALSEYQNKKYDARMAEDEIIAEINKLHEQQSCVIQEFKSISPLSAAVENPWGQVQRTCNLTYIEVENYQKKLGIHLENIQVETK